MNGWVELDDQVREYLVYRGFTASLKAFDQESKTDRTSNVDRLVDTLLAHVSQHEFTLLYAFWNTISKKYFTTLDSSQNLALRKIELSLYRYYLVTCVQGGRQDKVHEFFEKSAKYLPSYDWSDWYSLAFIKNAELNERFGPFFNRAWQDTFTVSLHNFLSIVLFTSPKPSLLNHRAEAATIQNLKDENFLLKTQVQKPAMAQTASGSNLPAAAADPSMAGDFLLVPHDPVTQNKSPGATATISKTIKAALPKPLKKRTSHQERSKQDKSGGSSFPRSASRPDIRERRSPELGSSHYSTALTNQTASPSLVTSQQDESYLLLSKDHYTEHSNVLRHCRFSSSGSLVASSDVAGIVKVWGYTNSVSTRTTIMSNSPVMALEWVNKHDNLLLLGNNRNVIRLYDVANKRSVQEVETPAAQPAVIALASAPNAARFLSSSTSPASPGGGGGGSAVVGGLICWNMKTFQMERQVQLFDPTIAVYCIDFNHNGNMVAIAGSDGCVRVLDVARSEQLLSWTAASGGHVVVSVRFSFHEENVFSLSSDGILACWSLNRAGSKLYEFSLSDTIKSSLGVRPFYPRLMTSDPHDSLFLLPHDLGLQILTHSAASGFARCQTVRTHSSPAGCLDWNVASNSLATVNGANSHELILCHLLKK